MTKVFLILKNAASYCAYGAKFRNNQVTKFHCKMREVLKHYIREENYILSLVFKVENY